MDPLGMSSGVPNLLIGAIQASKTLHETIQSFRNYERTIRDLRSELESLIGVLETLKTVVTTDEGPMISMLKIPVLCCHQTCQDFNAVIIKCTKHSAGSRASFRDWAQIRYMGGDIRDFKDMLAGYKSTIAIALGSLNMQNVQVTREALDGYHEMIRETTADLQAHLQDIDDKLAVITSHPQQDADPAANESIKRMEEEKQSAQQCLLICESARSHLQSLQDGFQPLGIRPDETHAKTAVALSDARDRMVRMISDLQGRLIALSEQSLSTKVVQPRQIEEDRLRLLKEIETARQCLEVCNLAADQASRQRVHVFGDVSADDNSHQVIVSTVGDLLNVKSVRVDRFSTQWLGSMTDASLQRLSSDRAASYSPSAPKEDDPAFRGKYGLGHKLQEKGLSVKQSSPTG
ncbi:hypothetical protein TrVFT333_000361 [Trichoderma virens FT-333]|nr:hypothetical protein TrVFT333_000361 [Trichoderma virens FT-333]